MGNAGDGRLTPATEWPIPGLSRNCEFVSSSQTPCLHRYPSTFVERERVVIITRLFPFFSASCDSFVRLAAQSIKGIRSSDRAGVANRYT